MRYWHLGVVSIAVLVLAACEQKKPEPAMQPEKDKSLAQMDNPPPATMDPYATDPYANKPAARPSDTGAAAKKAPAKTSQKEETVVPKGKAAGGKTYVVQKGDTLSSIAQKFYGDKKKWKVIWDANKSAVPNKDKLAPGTKLTIP
jgi:nucleoid-associated protein YgaU